MVDRPEIFHRVSDNAFEVIERPIGIWERLYGIAALRKVVLLLVLVAAWELYARWLHNPLLFPTFSETVEAFFASIRSGALPRAAAYTITLLLKGYGLGLLLAVILTAFASATRIGADLLETLRSPSCRLRSSGLVLETAA
jgi:NitT/TauT family transport system permease protein